MELAAGEDEVDAASKLDVGTQEGLGAVLGVVGDLLELIDGDIDLATTLGQPFKNLLDGQLGTRGLDGDGHLGHTRERVGREHRAQAAQEGCRLL